MPGGDRTGPMGFGPMTGRGAGYCAGYSVPGYGNPPGVRAQSPCRGGGGGGRGRCNQYYATGLTGWQRAARWQGRQYAPGPIPGESGPAMGREQGLEALKNQAEFMEKSLKDMKKRMDDLEAKGPKDQK